MLPRGYIVNYSINSSGFRGKEFPAKKDKKKIRIICIGDSSTFGYFLNLEDTYPYLLETTLNKGIGETKFEVINAGVMGYTSYQGRIYFEKILQKFEPDIITFACGFNDAIKWFPDRYFNPENDLKSKLQNILKYLAIYKLADKLIHELMGPHFGKPDIGPRVSSEEHVKNIQKLIRSCQNNSIRLVILPISFPESYIPLTKKLTYKKVNIGFIDLNSIFKKYSEDFFKRSANSYDGISLDEIRTRYYDDSYFYDIDKDDISRRKIRCSLFLDGCHPTPIGNRIIATEIYKYLTITVLLKSSR